MLRSFFVFLFVAGSALAATWDQLPLAVGLHEADPHAVEQGIGKSHPWKPGDALPVNFKDAGLTAPVTLVACDIYADGGSRFYIFLGANGKFAMLCSDSPISYSHETNQVSEVKQPRLYLAAAHCSAARKAEVPVDSATEHFLLEAIKSEVQRISSTQKK